VVIKKLLIRFLKHYLFTPYVVFEIGNYGSNGKFEVNVV